MNLSHRAKSLSRAGVTFLVGLVGLSGCGGGSEPQNNQCDVPALFAQKCGTIACHEGTATKLDLVSSGVENRVSYAAGKDCSGILADPSDPEGSILYEKVAASQPTCGARMPYGQPPLSTEEITCIRDWISGLLPPGPDTPDAGPDCPECACTPNAVESCYDGPDGTIGMGICVAGTRTCAPDGLSWGPCQGEVLPVGENCYTTDVDEDCDGQTPACSLLWSRGYGVENRQNMRSVALDSSDNVIALGDFTETLSFGGDPLVSSNSNHDILLAKYDKYGNHLWSKSYGDSSNQYATQVIVDSADNIVILGRAFGKINFGGVELDAEGTDDIFVAKFDGDGNHIWSWMFGGMDPDRAERIAVDSNNNVIMTGTFTGSVDFGSGTFDSRGMRDAVLLKLSANTGTHLFSLQIGGTGDEYGFGVDVDTQDNIVITGHFQDSITLGQTTLTSAGGTDIYVAKLDSVGNYLWAKRYGGTGDDRPYDLVVNKANDQFVITGYASETVNFGGGDLTSAGSRDIFLAKFDSNGDHLFSQLYGDSGDQFENTDDTNTWSSLALDSSGNMYLAGSLAYTASFGGPTLASSGRSDAYFVKLSPTGSFLFGIRYGTSASEFCLDIGVSSTNDIVLVGRYFGTSLNFGTAGSIKGFGGGDAFITHLSL